MKIFDSQYQASEFLNTFKCLRKDKDKWLYRETIELHNKYLISFGIRIFNEPFITEDFNSWRLETYVWQTRVSFQEFLSLIPPSAAQEFLFHLDVFN